MFSTAKNDSQRQGCGIQWHHTCCLQESLWERAVIPISAFEFHWMWHYFTNLASQQNLHTFFPKDYYLQFFIVISWKDFLKGYTATYTCAKIYCLHRNLWVNVCASEKTTVMFLMRIHLGICDLKPQQSSRFLTKRKLPNKHEVDAQEFGNMLLLSLWLLHINNK